MFLSVKEEVSSGLWLSYYLYQNVWGSSEQEVCASWKLLLTKNSMEQSPSREAGSSSASQEITHSLWILEFHYCSDCAQGHPYLYLQSHILSPSVLYSQTPQPMLFEDLHVRIQKFYCRKCGKFTLVCAVACNVVQCWGTSLIAAVVVSEKVTGDWEIFHSEVLGDSYSSTDLIMVIKSHAGPVECMGKKL